uniref:Uncharacterized protein n=1 Tax=Ascaris lumbricoides TaxID=6252 RepID=A0A0M3I392_ASCLU
MDRVLCGYLVAVESKFERSTRGEQLVRGTVDGGSYGCVRLVIEPCVYSRLNMSNITRDNQRSNQFQPFPSANVF